MKTREDAEDQRVGRLRVALPFARGEGDRDHDSRDDEDPDQPEQPRTPEPPAEHAAPYPADGPKADLAPL